jgi:hypothetical protein
MCITDNMEVEDKYEDNADRDYSESDIPDDEEMSEEDPLNKAVVPFTPLPNKGPYTTFINPLALRKRC